LFLGYEPDGFPFEGNFHKLPFLNTEASVGNVRYGNLEIIIVLTLFEEERMLCTFLNDTDDLTCEDFPPNSS